jgi:tRNA(Ile)-lysidine synthase
MTRGRESDKDEAFVRELCSRFSLTCHIQREDVPRYCEKFGKSLETGAREVRYRFFNHLIQELGYQHLATGHNANDQAETILFRIIRGTGIPGIRGIPLKREHYIRPLLAFNRREIEIYAKTFDLDYRYDKSNDLILYRRNYIRHELIPDIEKELNPGVIESLNRLGVVMGDAYAMLNELAMDAFRRCLKFADETKIILDIVALMAYFKILQKNIIDLALERFGIKGGLDYQAWQKMTAMLKKGDSQKRLEIQSNIYIASDSRDIVIYKQQKDIRDVYIETIPGTFRLWDEYFLEINYDARSLEQIRNNRNRNCIWIDAEQIEMPLKVRTFRKGDTFFPLSMTGQKKVSDYFIDEKISFYKRNRLPILEDANGIIWICGYRLDDRYRVTFKTKKILGIELQHV